MIIRFEGKASREELCKWVEVAKSSLHYRLHPGSRGIKASAHTPIGDGMVTILDCKQKRKINFLVNGKQFKYTSL